ncbi:hypothetical protein DFQ28_002472 [Apophysomyces sp. BC1034]|nr:hypothetical protein DFQ30_010243 [Apophysomyces sp. BC1015]KAG0190109.1 hypothetical protein DFQ28_002472 [Apophysomyces sp. BC1034]
MIISFRHKGLEVLFRDDSTRGVQAAHAPKLRRILAALDAASTPIELNYPGYKLHRVRGELHEHWSIWSIIRIITESYAMMKNHPHPGELLREDVLQALGIDVSDAATRLGYNRTTLSRVLHGHAGISPDLAVRLERANVSTARFWMTLQSNYELSLAEQREQPDVRPFQPVSVR